MKSSWAGIKSMSPTTGRQTLNHKGNLSFGFLIKGIFSECTIYVDSTFFFQNFKDITHCPSVHMIPDEKVPVTFVLPSVIYLCSLDALTFLVYSNSNKICLG